MKINLYPVSNTDEFQEHYFTGPPGKDQGLSYRVSDILKSHVEFLRII